MFADARRTDEYIGTLRSKLDPTIPAGSESA